MRNKNNLLKCEEFTDALMDAVFIDRIYEYNYNSNHKAIKAYLTQILKDNGFVDKNVKYASISVYKDWNNNPEEGFNLIITDRLNTRTSNANFHITKEFIEEWRDKQ